MVDQHTDRVQKLFDLSTGNVDITQSENDFGVDDAIIMIHALASNTMTEQPLEAGSAVLVEILQIAGYYLDNLVAQEP